MVLDSSLMPELVHLPGSILQCHHPSPTHYSLSHALRVGTWPKPCKCEFTSLPDRLCDPPTLTLCAVVIGITSCICAMISTLTNTLSGSTSVSLTCVRASPIDSLLSTYIRSADLCAHDLLLYIESWQHSYGFQPTGWQSVQRGHATCNVLCTGGQRYWYWLEESRSLYQIF